MKGGKLKQASVLIRTLNEAAALPATLASVLSQQTAPFEIIVIDSGSTDETVPIAREWGARVIELGPEEWSYPRALNLGAEVASGEVLVCLSAHSVPIDDKWLTYLLRHFDDPVVAAVWGQELNESRADPVPGPPSRYGRGSYTAETRRWGLSNANSALRRSLWEELRFDERLPAAEDKAWAREVMARGWVTVYEPAAVTRHGRHRPLHAFRRNRSIVEGYRVIFPELVNPADGNLRHLWREAAEIARERRTGPRALRPSRDLKHLLTVVFHLLGGLVAGRRRFGP